MTIDSVSTMKSLVIVVTLYVCCIHGQTPVHSLNVVLENGENERTIQIEIGTSNSLKHLRDKLISQGMMSSRDTNTERWRFLADTNTENMNLENSGDYVVSKNTEQRAAIQQYLVTGSNRRVYVKLINLKNLVMKRQIKIVKGNEFTTINVDLSNKLSVLRSILIGKQYHDGRQFTFMSSNGDACVSWRFIRGNGQIIKSDEVEQLTSIADILFEKYGETIIEIVNEFEVNMKSVTIFKGLKEVDIRISGSRRLSDLRKILAGDFKCYGQQYNFLHSNNLEDWIVLKKKANVAQLDMGHSGLRISPNLIVTHDEEEAKEIDSVLFNTKDIQFCLEYVNQRGSPGLIGERVTEYVTKIFSEKASLKVTKDVPTDSQIEPIMLTNVHATNENTMAMHDVILFEKNTDIRFWINTEPKTPFWIVISSGGDDVIVSTRGDHGEQFYFAMTKPGMGGRAITVQSNEIRNEGDLRDPKFVRRVTVELYHLITPNNRQRRGIVGSSNSTTEENDDHSFKRMKRSRVRENVAACGECKENGRIDAGGEKPTGDGSDSGYSPGNLFATFLVHFLVFRDREVADQIVQRIALIEDGF